MITNYDEMRDRLKAQLEDALRLCREMLDESISGYEEYKPDYALTVYTLVKKAKDEV